ncbi:MAG: hypothetical protein R6V83_10725 [Candidatus Thorarchaeota archaeon]
MKTIDTQKKSAKKRHEKLRIALSGILRLLSGEKSILTRVSGKPKDLRKYVIELADNLEEESLNDLEAVRSEIQDLLSTVEGSDYGTKNIGWNDCE